MLKVKICGITRTEDARAAAAAGADAIGLVFHQPSPRAVTTVTARQIVSALPPWMAKVGVFVNANPADVRRAVETVGLTAIQLHGEETLEYIEYLNLSIPVIKAIAVRDGWERRLAYYANLPVLLDSARPDAAGGTGEAWDYARFDRELRPSWFVLAGGLNPENVAGAVERLQPDAVDVSTGVESSPGVKDAAKMAAFMSAVAPFRSVAKAKGNN
jgi:phosphoribosylanthranilate isomerase